MTHIVVCCDGLDPAYLCSVDTPGWNAIRSEGHEGTCHCVLPSLTNVNNVSIATGKSPNEHGITGNTYYDQTQGKRIYMKEPSFLRCKTQFQKKTTAGKKVGVLVAKEKLRKIIGQNCTITVSAETPPSWIENEIGLAPDIYSGKASAWLMNAAQYILTEHDLDWLYVSTTDVIPHKYSPVENAAKKWVAAIDNGISTLHKQADEIVVTADHGMSQKNVCIDVEKFLSSHGHDSKVIRLIRDKHTYHHQNLGGAAYVYTNDNISKIKKLLTTVGEIDTMLTATQAENQLNLPADRIGDIMILGNKKTVFGPVENGIRKQIDVRSHGSQYEQKVPYVMTQDTELSSNFQAISAIQ